MRLRCRSAALLSAVAVVGLLGLWGTTRDVQGQGGTLGPNSEFELAETVQLDRADNAVLANLERAKAYLADRQWSEAVETLRQVMESSGGMLLGVTDRRWVSVRDYCHLQLAGLPPPALALYRSRVDPLAEKWYQEGIATLNRQSLLNVAEQAFASSWGDKAMMALGELALESGDYASARGYWERIIPVDPPSAAATWLAYPDTHLDLAAVRARLVLVSIFEGSAARARDELAQLARLHPNARGWLGGQDVNYVQALGALLTESAHWPQPAPSPDWPTFAGSPSRDKTAVEVIDVGDVAWRIPLRKGVAPKAAPAGVAAIPRVAEDANAPLSCHPVVVGDLVLACNELEILAVNAATGRPAWGDESADVYRDQFDNAVPGVSTPSDMLGVPRYTMTAAHGKVFARMGPPVTGQSQGSTVNLRPGELVCLDLEAQGRLLWKAVPEEGWALEGSPLADGTDVYVAMRRSDIRPQAHVACFDVQTGRLRWRRFVCAAETPARAMLHECTHNLLTLHRDTLYYNTNLGAVAALSARDGQLKWVSLYPRSRHGDVFKLAPHWQRDLTPCLYHQGALLVAPADSQRIFALDAATGQILWQTGPEVEDVVHLLGISDDHLIASGHRLYWIGLKDSAQGKVRRAWPESNEKLGYGRGVLAGGHVYWPTREKIYVLDPKTAQPGKVIDLTARGATGGNLLIARGRLLIATSAELIALNYRGRSPREQPEVTTQTNHPPLAPNPLSPALPRGRPMGPTQAPL